MRFDHLADWLAWQESLHPKSIDLGLDRVREVASRLGVLSPGCPVITVGGTNGKGSCVALLQAILLAAGRRVGTYTSPHLLRYNERIRIDGQEVDDAELCMAFERIDQARGDISLSYFEFGTLAALVLFAQANLDAVILEVGLGGRLDAVNIVDADVAIVASVGTDHREWLGEGREAVGREKAGIFREGRPAICGDPNPPQSIATTAGELGADLLQIGRDFHLRLPVGHEEGWTWSWRDQRMEALPLPALPGRVQLFNAACCITALTVLKERLGVTRSAVEAGLRNMLLSGRFQRVPGEVETVLDVAHNPEAAEALVEALREDAVPGRTFVVFATLGDKDAKAIARILRPAVSAWYIGRLQVARARPVRDLVEEVRRVTENQPVQTYDDVLHAYAAARAAVRPGDRILVCGSFYTVAEVLSKLV